MTLDEIFRRTGFATNASELGPGVSRSWRSPEGRDLVLILTNATGGAVTSETAPVSAALYEVTGGSLELLVSDEFPDLGTAFDAVIEPPWVEP